LKKLLVILILFILSSYYGFTRESPEKLIKDLGSSDGSVVQDAVWTLTDLGSDVIEPLISALGSNEEEEIRLRCAMILGFIGDDRAVEPLLDALKDRNGDVRAAAITAISDLGKEEYGKILLPYLNDSNEKIRLSAIVAIYNLGEPQTLKELKPRLIEFIKEDGDPMVRYYSVKVLGNLGESENIPYILSAL